MPPPFTILIQARMGSSRLPGKVLRPFAGSTILNWQLRVLQPWREQIVLATTGSPEDDPLADWAERQRIGLLRGSVTDVLGRLIKGARAPYILRICADNPLLQMDDFPKWLNLAGRDYDYISYSNAQGIPAIKTHWGLYPELVKTAALQRAAQAIQGHAREARYREHVTNYLYEHPRDFNIKLLPAPAALRQRSDLRFTIDDEKDFRIMEALCRQIKQSPDLKELLDLVDNQPEIKASMLENIKRYPK